MNHSIRTIATIAVTAVLVIAGAGNLTARGDGPPKNKALVGSWLETVTFPPESGRPALKSLGMNNDISASADYTTSQVWARAIHGASSRWDGIRYVSRQMNKGFAYAIFERTGLRKLKAEKLKAWQLDDLCDLFNVTAV